MENLLTTCGNEGRLRDYDHYGVEPRLRAALPLFGRRSELEVGVRYHAETQERRQENGDTPLARSGRLVEDNRRENRALAGFVQDRLRLGDFTLSAGVRFEAIGYERTNRLADGGAGASGVTSITVWVPGAGLTWPTDFVAMTPPGGLPVASIAANNALGVVVGRFAWTPNVNAFGHDCLLMIASTAGDASNIDNFTSGETIEDWRLVPHDNNVGQRNGLCTDRLARALCRRAGLGQHRSRGAAVPQGAPAEVGDVSSARRTQSIVVAGAPA